MSEFIRETTTTNKSVGPNPREVSSLTTIGQN